MITIGVIGLGYWGPNLVRNFSTCTSTRVRRVCDSDAARLEAIGSQFPAAARSRAVDEVLADSSLDAVAIATPVATHYQLARAALLADKHVLVEKPLAASTAEAEDLVALAKQKRKILLVDHVFVHSPSVKRMAQLIRAGEVGDILFFDSVRINLGLFQHDVNVLWDLAPHDLSIIDFLIDRAPLSVTAVGACHAGNGLEDVAYLHLDYGHNVLASVHVNWLSPVKVRYFLVAGSRRSILYDELNISERVKVYDRGIDLSNDPEGVRKVQLAYRSGDVLSPYVESKEPLLNLVEHFVDCIENGTQPVSGGTHGLRVVRILEAAQQSLARNGARVEI